jgi:hypothetical protein
MHWEIGILNTAEKIDWEILQEEETVVMKAMCRL